MTPKLYKVFVFRAFIAIIMFCFGFLGSYGQSEDSTQDKLVQSFSSISKKGLNVLNNRYELLQKAIDKQTQKMLKRMQSREEKLQKKLQGIDSIKSKELFAKTKKEYEALKKLMQSPLPNPGFAQKLKTYIPKLDSMQTALNFLKQKNMGIPLEKMQQLQQLGDRLKLLQQKMQSAGQIHAYIQQREQLLKSKLSNFGFDKQLVGINKEAYYYQQRLTGYKAMINDRDKLKQAVLNEVTKQPAFQNFWQKHSMLAAMFPIPQAGDDIPASAMASLQTRSQVSGLIQQATGKAPAGNIASSEKTIGNADGYLQQQAGQAKSLLDKLKNKLAKYEGNSSDIVMPDFKPNNQKTKTFLKRLEYGFNFQNAQGTTLLPATSDIATSLGYRICDKATAGVGLAYKLGWGAPVKDIHFSNQGIGLRSYVDIKAKGSLWITGGWEYNYLPAMAAIATLPGLSTWQKSGLIGLTKKVKAGGKTTNLQVLYDFFANKHLSQTTAFKFRVGYSF